MPAILASLSWDRSFDSRSDISRPLIVSFDTRVIVFLSIVGLLIQVYHLWDEKAKHLAKFFSAFAYLFPVSKNGVPPIIHLAGAVPSGPAGAGARGA